jgi:hypothetical protein
MLRTSAVDAFALTHDALPALAAQLPGSRILDGSFLQTGIPLPCQRTVRTLSPMQAHSWKTRRRQAWSGAKRTGKIIANRLTCWVGRIGVHLSPPFTVWSLAERGEEGKTHVMRIRTLVWGTIFLF